MDVVISAKAGRTTNFVGTLKDADGNFAVLGSTDILRFKIGHAGDVPMLDLKSGSGTAPGPVTDGGSSISIVELGDGASVDATYSLILGQGDMTMQPGNYDLEVLLVDDAANDADEPVQDGIVYVLPSMGGNV